MEGISIIQWVYLIQIIVNLTLLNLVYKLTVIEIPYILKKLRYGIREYTPHERVLEMLSSAVIVIFGVDIAALVINVVIDRTEWSNLIPYGTASWIVSVLIYVFYLRVYRYRSPSYNRPSYSTLFKVMKKVLFLGVVLLSVRLSKNT